MASPNRMQMIDNYIYLYHVDTFIILPSFADSVTDQLQANFDSTTPLSRSAPIYSYMNSGPRSMQVSFTFHRDMLNDINIGKSNALLQLGTDYVDTLIKQIQAAVLPTYESASSMVNPPIVALRLGNDIFIKGVINGGLSVTYHYPILSNGKYAYVDISFNISEIDPYDAYTVMKTGSYRGLSTTLERKILSGGSNSPFTGDMSYGSGFTSNTVNDVYDIYYNNDTNTTTQTTQSKPLASIKGRTAQDVINARVAREQQRKILEEEKQKLKAQREDMALEEWANAIEQGRENEVVVSGG